MGVREYQSDLTNGPPDPDEGWIHSAEEAAFDVRPTRDRRPASAPIAPRRSSRASSATSLRWSSYAMSTTACASDCAAGLLAGVSDAVRDTDRWARTCPPCVLLACTGDEARRRAGPRLISHWENKAWRAVSQLEDADVLVAGAGGRARSGD